MRQRQQIASGEEFLVEANAGLASVRITTTDGRSVTVANVLAFGEVQLPPLSLPALAGPDTRDLDGDSIPAATDPDDDGDGCRDADEPLQTRMDPGSCADLDGDGFGVATVRLNRGELGTAN